MTSSLSSRYAGTLIGAACGDALGATLEFERRKDIEARYPDGFRDIVGGGWLHLAPGETTDDTAMMLAIARACTAEGLDLDQVAANFVSWMETGPKDIGTQTRQALILLHHGRSWDEAGEELQAGSVRGVAGNGSVMRCAPVALRFRSEPERLVRAALDSSRITHADPRAMWSCVAVNQAIAHLLDGGAINNMVAAAVHGVPVKDVVDAVRSAASLIYEDVRSGGFVLETVTAAFWCLLHEFGAEEVIVRAVMMGGDADTTGIVAGALAGAAYGLEAIPERWRAVLQGRKELESLAIQLMSWDTASENRLHGYATE
jgi:ADP-ribosyl-[dinitrogen reductase] hydrolase